MPPSHFRLVKSPVQIGLKPILYVRKTSLPFGRLGFYHTFYQLCFLAGEDCSISIDHKVFVPDLFL